MQILSGMKQIEMELISLKWHLFMEIEFKSNKPRECKMINRHVNVKR